MPLITTFNDLSLQGPRAVLEKPFARGKNGESIEGWWGAHVGYSPSTSIPAPSSIPGPAGGCHHPWGSGQPRLGAQLDAGGTWRGQEHPLGELQEGAQSQQHSYTSPRVSPWRFPYAPAPKRLQAGEVSSRSQTPRTWLEIKRLPTWFSKAAGVVLRARDVSPSMCPPVLVPLKLLRFHVSFSAPSLPQQDRPAKAKFRIKTSLGCSGAKPAHGLAALSTGRMGTAGRWQNWCPQCPVLVMLAPARCLHM